MQQYFQKSYLQRLRKATTKGENLEFKTPSVSGKAMAIANGDWKIKETFATEEEAVGFIKEYLGITDDASVSVAKEDSI